jgi:translocation and assembly module TamB
VRLRRLRLAVYTLAVLLLLGGYGLLGTTAGFYFLLRTVNTYTPLQVSVASASGSMAGGLDLDRLAIRSAGLSLTADRTGLRLEVMGLLAGRLHLARLHMDNINVSLGGTTPGAAPPLPVVIDDLRLTRVAVNGPGDRHSRFDSLHAALRAEDGVLGWDRLSLYRDDVAVHGDGQLRLGTPPRIRASLTWSREQKDKIPALAGSVHLKGDTRKLTLNARLRQPLAATLKLTARDLISGLHWEGDLTVPAVNPAALADNFPRLHAALTLHGSGSLDNAEAQGSLILSDIQVPGIAIAAPGTNTLPLDIALTVRRGDDGYHAEGTAAWTRNGVRLHRGKLALSLPSGRLGLKLAASGFQFSADAPLQLNQEQGKIHVVASGKGTAVNLDTIRLDLGKGTLQSRGVLDLAPGRRTLQISSNWQNLTLPVGERRFHSPRGKLKLNGGLDDYTADASMQLEGGGLPATSLDLHAVGKRDGLRLEPVTLKLLDGRVQGTGMVAWRGGLSAELRLSGQGLNPGRLWPSWPGTLGGNGRVRLEQAAGGYVLTLGQWDVQGRLRERPVTLSLDSVLAPGAITLKRAELASGDASLGLQGRLARDHSDLRWHIDVPDLAALIPDGAGKVQGRGEFQGSPARPALSLKLQAQGVRSPWLRAGALDADMNVNLQEDNGIKVALTADDLAWRGLAVKQAELQAAGSGSNHHYSLALKNQDGELHLAGTGLYADGRWEGRTNELQLQYGDFGTWRLKQAATVHVSHKQVNAEPLCLVHDASSICLGGNWQDAGHWDGHIAMQAVPFGLGKPYFPYFLDVQGNFDLKLRARRNGRDTRASADLSLAPGTVAFQIDVKQFQRFHYDSGGLSLSYDNHRLHGDMNLNFTNMTTPLKADLTLTGLTDPLHPVPARVSVRGSASGRVDDLGFIASITPYVTDVRGKLGVNLAMAGTLAKPDLSGTFQLSDAGFYVPDLGISLEKMSVRGDSTPSGAYEFHGQWQSGKGITHIKAHLQQTPKGAPELHATLSGKDAEIINLPEVWAVASSELTLDVSPKHNSVKGNVLVSRGTINLDEIKSSTPVSKDVVIVGHPSKAKTRRLPPLKTDVTVSFGDDLKVKGQGISGKLKGKLNIQSDSKENLIGNGEIQIADGTYSAYGKSLKIEEGRLIYQNSPLKDPEVRVRAVRQIEDKDITAGVQVSGYLNNPNITLFSTPPMNQEETLSYLVFGRPLNSLSTGQGTDLVSAVTTLGLQNSGFLTNSLANTFGLSELKVKTQQQTQTGQTTASLIAGKYLTPRLYLSYGIGLFQSLNTIRLRYDISKRWSIEAEQGTETSADILYKVGK